MVCYGMVSGQAKNDSSNKSLEKSRYSIVKKEKDTKASLEKSKPGLIKGK